MYADGTPSPVADFIPKQQPTRVSSLHVVPAESAEVLSEFLADRGLRTLQAVLAERGYVTGEWVAEHAQAQLAVNSGCESSPAWVAWLVAEQAAEPEYTLSLWAQDGRAARRALLALQLQHAAVVYVAGLPRALLPQLERWAFERGDTELLDGGSAEAEALAPPSVPQALQRDALAHTECSSMLAKRSGAKLEALRQARAAAGAEDEELAMERLQELSRRLLLIDPKAEMDVAPASSAPEQRGRLSVLAVRMNGHVMSWGGEIDRCAGCFLTRGSHE